MEVDKTYTLRLKPIEEITTEEIIYEVLAYNNKEFMQGKVSRHLGGKYYNCYKNGTTISRVTHFAVLPKNE